MLENSRVWRRDRASQKPTKYSQDEDGYPFPNNLISGFRRVDHGHHIPNHGGSKVFHLKYFKQIHSHIILIKLLDKIQFP